jgi:hypothetical protein
MSRRDDAICSVISFFGSGEKAADWFMAFNPLLCCRPFDMIDTDKEERLLSFIENAIDENTLE